MVLIGVDDGWRWVFLVNVFVGAAELPVAIRILPRRHDHEEHSLDTAGNLLLTAVLVLLLVPLVEGRTAGWPLWSWIVLALSLPAVAMLAWWEVRLGRRGGEPVLHLSGSQVTARLLAGPLLLAGASNGLVITSNQEFVLSSLSRGQAGTAGASLYTAQQLGAAVGIAVIGTALFGSGSKGSGAERDHAVPGAHRADGDSREPDLHPRRVALRLRPAFGTRRRAVIG